MSGNYTIATELSGEAKILAEAAKAASREAVAQAFAAATNGEFRVLLQHDPLTAERNLREGGVDLQLSGHTHGFFFPGLARIMASHYGGYVRGLYRRGDAAVYVNPACGQWRGFPLRYFNPQELTLITLRRSRK